MFAYILRRLLLIPVTLFFIFCLNFVLIQWIPGGPVDKLLAELQGSDNAQIQIVGAAQDVSQPTATIDVSAETRAKIEALYGFDKPVWERFWLMMKRYSRFDLGNSFFQSQSVWQIILSKLPVSISLGFWSVILVYAVSLSLGIAKAHIHGGFWDGFSSIFVLLGYAVPGFLFGFLLIVLFASGNFWALFPLRGLTSTGSCEWSWGARIADYAWHMALPLTTQVLGGFASITLLTKNAFLEEMGKAYILTARVKGLREGQILWRHVFRNALTILAVGFPHAFMHMFFTGALLTEVLFSLDGLGLLGYYATLSRDYPVIFGALFIFCLMRMVLHLISDVLYTRIDPRLHFDKAGG